MQSRYDVYIEHSATHRTFFTHIRMALKLNRVLQSFEHFEYFWSLLDGTLCFEHPFLSLVSSGWKYENIYWNSSFEFLLINESNEYTFWRSMGSTNCLSPWKMLLIVMVCTSSSLEEGIGISWLPSTLQETGSSSSSWMPITFSLRPSNWDIGRIRCCFFSQSIVTLSSCFLFTSTFN